MATLVRNVSFGNYTLPPLYGSHVIPLGGGVVIADTPENVSAALGSPPGTVLRVGIAPDGQQDAIFPSGSGVGGGVACVLEFDAPAAQDLVGVSSPGLAASDASNAFVIDGALDIPRNVQIPFPGDWDAGDVVVAGTDPRGRAQTEVIANTPGATAVGVKAFATVTGASKSAVGAGVGLATIGLGSSIWAGTQLAGATALLSVDNADEPVTMDPVNNTFTPTVSVPDGHVSYKLVVNT